MGIELHGLRLCVAAAPTTYRVKRHRQTAENVPSLP
jgi:hypothetical protein